MACASVASARTIVTAPTTGVVSGFEGPFPSYILDNSKVHCSDNVELSLVNPTVRINADTNLPSSSPSSSFDFGPIYPLRTFSSGFGFFVFIRRKT